MLGALPCTPHKVVLNHGVELHSSAERQRKRVLELCEQFFRQVPVLVIAASNEELGQLHKAVCGSSVIPQADNCNLVRFVFDDPFASAGMDVASYLLNLQSGKQWEH